MLKLVSWNIAGRVRAQCAQLKWIALEQPDVLALQEVEDNWIDPERMIVSMPCAQARKYQRLLREMNQDQRIADRRALLFLD